DLVSDDLFLGHRITGSQGRVFGGQVLGQALMAASKTVSEDKQVHSCHNYFIRPGENVLPIHYQVHRDLDGRNFSNRRVVAMQNDKPIFNLITSFQTSVKGVHHQKDMLADIPGPEGLLNENELVVKYRDQVSDVFFDMINTYHPVEVRPINEEAHFLRCEKKATQTVWFKVRESLPTSPDLHRSILAYATDLTLLSTCGRPHDMLWSDKNIMTASIDHALWLHSRDFRVDQWLLYVMDSPWSGDSRGLNMGSIYTREGELIASVAQEGLIRLKDL
uniref:acyl-CoA thioesterase n=1 Tax=Pseudomaricurvus sp. TaxID=2004510 RepID=UPI003F6BDC7D